MKNKPGQVFLVENVNEIKTLDKYIVVEVWKTGEKVKKVYRGRKPQGYNVYKNSVWHEFLPYGERSQFVVKKTNL